MYLLQFIVTKLRLCYLNDKGLSHLRASPIKAQVLMDSVYFHLVIVDEFLSPLLI